MEMIEGDLPKRAKKMIIEWGKMYKNELIEIWNTQKIKKLPGLE